MTGTTTTPNPTAPPETAGGRAVASAQSARRRRTKRRLVLVFALLAAALVFLLVEGLGSSLDYFDTVNQALAHRGQLGTTTFRLEGNVVPGSIRSTATGADFRLCQGANVVAVVEHRQPAGPVPAEYSRRPGRPLQLGHVAHVPVEHHHGEALRHLYRAVPGSGPGDCDLRLLMVDAHLGAIGVWLAFVASIVGAAVMAFGLARPRRAARPGPRAAASRSGLARGTGGCSLP